MRPVRWRQDRDEVEPYPGDGGELDIAETKPVAAAPAPVASISANSVWRWRRPAGGPRQRLPTGVGPTAPERTSASTTAAPVNSFGMM